MRDIKTYAQLRTYLNDGKRSQSPKTQAVLNILIENPTGVFRCCLRARLQEQGIDIGQPAAQIRDLRASGVNIPKQPSKGYCDTHNRTDTLDMLEAPYITGNDYARAIYSPKEIKSIQTLLGNTDAFTMIRVSTALEVDHRIPVGRMMLSDEVKESRVNATDFEAVNKQYQLLTRETNLYKSRMCECCVDTETKPAAFLGIEIPESMGGSQPFVEGKNDCSSCPFAFPEKFRNNITFKELV
jgi:hypothetical protein